MQIRVRLLQLRQKVLLYLLKLRKHNLLVQIFLFPLRPRNHLLDDFLVDLSELDGAVVGGQNVERVALPRESLDLVDLLIDVLRF